MVIEESDPTGTSADPAGSSDGNLSQPDHPEAAYRIAVVDDHILVRDGVATAAREMPGISVVLETDSLTELAAVQPPPDLVLLDLDLHGVAVRPDEVAEITGRGSQVLIVSAMAYPSVVRHLVSHGVAGYVPKRDSTAATLGEAIATVRRGEYWTTPALAAMLSSDNSSDRPDLSERERRALALYASGLKMTSVARRMGISQHTAKRYIDRVRAKYAATGRSVSSKTSLYRAAVTDGFIASGSDSDHGE